MSIEVKRSDGTVSLNDREKCLRLVQEGAVTSFDSEGDAAENITMYKYQVTVPAPIDNEVFILFIKSDFDKVTRTESISISGSTAIITFWSSANTSKEYKYFAPYSFDTFSTSTDYGAVIYSQSGELIYDSRVKECVLKDFFTVSDRGTTSTHLSTATAWYSLNLFPIDVDVVPTNTPGLSLAIFSSYRQISSTEVEIVPTAFGVSSSNPTTVSNQPDTNMVLLDP